MRNKTILGLGLLVSFVIYPNAGSAGPLTEAVLLGSVCVRLGGGKLRWDSAQLKITNKPEANTLIHYKYREGWSL